jgi:hypothetical protein
MRIHVTTAPRRPKPRVGDTKVVKGVTYVRQLAYVHDRHGNRIGLDCTGGKQRYVWELANQQATNNKE